MTNEVLQHSLFFNNHEQSMNIIHRLPMSVAPLEQTLKELNVMGRADFELNKIYLQ